MSQAITADNAVFSPEAISKSETTRNVANRSGGLIVNAAVTAWQLSQQGAAPEAQTALDRATTITSQGATAASLVGDAAPIAEAAGIGSTGASIVGRFALPLGVAAVGFQLANGDDRGAAGSATAIAGGMVAGAALAGAPVVVTAVTVAAVGYASVKVGEHVYDVARDMATGGERGARYDRIMDNLPAKPEATMAPELQTLIRQNNAMNEAVTQYGANPNRDTLAAMQASQERMMTAYNQADAVGCLPDPKAAQSAVDNNPELQALMRRSGASAGETPHAVTAQQAPHAAPSRSTTAHR